VSERIPSQPDVRHHLRCRIDHPKAAKALGLIPRHLSPTFVAHCILWALQDRQAMLPWAPYLGEMAPEAPRLDARPDSLGASASPAEGKGPSEPDLSFLGGFGADLPGGTRP
jgi:hypothetical protein